MFPAIHPNALIALATVLFGLILGIALALSDWRSKFAIGGIIGTFAGPLASLTADKVSAVKQFIDSSTLVTPLLYCLNIALGMFVLTLVGGTSVVFLVNYLGTKRRNDPEAFIKAARRATAILGSGLYHYVTAPPELAAANKIRELEKHIDSICLLHNTLANETSTPTHSVQHFKDSVNAVGRLLLQHSFGESPDLQHFRMAFFHRQRDRLEYMVAIDNGDWTAHTMEGFDLDSSFLGIAIRENRPLIYPKDKKFRMPYAKRKQARYKSFLAVPVPCGHKDKRNIGAITIDYTGKHTIFTELRINEAFAFAQFVFALYLLNVEELH